MHWRAVQWEGRHSGFSPYSENQGGVLHTDAGEKREGQFAVDQQANENRRMGLWVWRKSPPFSFHRSLDFFYADAGEGREREFSVDDGGAAEAVVFDEEGAVEVGPVAQTDRGSSTARLNHAGITPDFNSRRRPAMISASHVCSPVLPELSKI